MGCFLANVVNARSDTIRVSEPSVSAFLVVAFKPVVSGYGELMLLEAESRSLVLICISNVSSSVMLDSAAGSEII